MTEPLDPGAADPSAADPSAADPGAADPGAAAVAHHLDALDRLWAEADASGLATTPGASRAAAARAAANRMTSDVRRRALAPVEHRARQASDHLASAVEALAGRTERMAAWQGDDHKLLGDVRHTVDQVGPRLGHLDAGVAEILARLDDIDRHQVTRQAQIDELRGDLARVRILLDDIVVGTRAAIAQAVAGTPRPNEAAAHAATPGAASPNAGGAQGPNDTRGTIENGDPLDELLSRGNDGFYRDLERRFRGSRADVKTLLSVHLEAVQQTGGPVVDIGCGRGEWLELLAEAEVPAYGVDLNAAFAEANQERGLDVRVGEAGAHLAGLAPASLGAVTGFHLAEHLPLPVLLRLAQHAYRALRPGGVLVLETPNPTNVRVGAAQFWLDPTHERPLHPELLQFALSHVGFDPVEVVPLHPARNFDRDWAAELGIDAPAGSAAAEILEDVRAALSGPQDYAVVARVPSPGADGDPGDVGDLGEVGDPGES